MIHPSYVELMKVVNNDVEIGEEPVVNSRYSIVLATAKRARQIIDGDEPLVDDAEGKKPLSIAVEELNDKKVKIVSEEEFEAQQNQMLSFEEDFDEFEEDEEAFEEEAFESGTSETIEE